PGMDVSRHHGADVQHLARLPDHWSLPDAGVPGLQDVRQDHDDRHMILVFLSLCVVAAVLLAFSGIRGLLGQVPQESRDYQDPLPGALKMMWPLVSAATYVIGPRLKPADLEKSHRALQSAGQDYLVTPEELAGLRVVSSGIATTILLLLMAGLHYLNVWTFVATALFGMVVGWYYPSLWLGERRKTRRNRVIRDLPIFLDFITMAVEAGLNITGAIEQAVLKGPVGPLG